MTAVVAGALIGTLAAGVVLGFVDLLLVLIGGRQ